MKTKLNFLTILMVLAMACDNDDEPTPTPIPDPKSGENQLISFRFTGIEKDGIKIEIPANVDQQAKTIEAEMPSGTDITNIAPEVEISDKATYEPTGPQDFSKPINYTVTAEDGTSRTYLVTIAVALSQKEILLKISEANPDNTLNWREDDNINDWQEVELDGEGKVIELSLDFKNLSVLPPEIGQLQSLKSLVLYGNNLESLPSEIGQLQNLASLDLSENDLTSLPSEVGQLDSLKILTLARNDLTTFPSEIGQLQGLHLLNLISNSLTSLPSEVRQLDCLRVLYLANNSLTSLPPEIGQLTKLSALGLQQNGLSEIPPEIGQLSQLHSLDLGSNALTILPNELSLLSNLVFLDLSNNSLEGLGINHIPMVNSNPLIKSCESNLKQLFLAGNKVPMILDACICELDTDNGGTVDIDIVVEEGLNNPLVRCLGDVIGN